MSISLYELTVESYLQTLSGAKTVLAKGAEHALAEGENLDDFVNLRLHSDMAPLSFQAISVWHHSLGAINGIREGVFAPPPKKPDLDYAGLQALVDQAHAVLSELEPGEINKLTDKSLVFRIGDREIPFTAINFARSFSLPNFYFHAATLYDVLRMHGVPLGKMMFLGPLRIG